MTSARVYHAVEEWYLHLRVNLQIRSSAEPSASDTVPQLIRSCARSQSALMIRPRLCLTKQFSSESAHWPPLISGGRNGNGDWRVLISKGLEAKPGGVLSHLGLALSDVIAL